MKPKYTIVDLVENFSKIDPQYLKDIIYKLDSGLEVLPGPARLVDSELLQPQQLENILNYVRSQNLYRWLVLDLGDFLDEFTIRALELSDLVLLVTVLTIPGLRDAQKVLETLKLLDFNPEKIQPVANSYNKNADISLPEAEKFLGREFFSVLRFDSEAVVRSINEGRPLVETQPRHRLSGDFAGLVQKLQHEGEENGNRPGILGKLKSLLHMGDKS
jgi:pilus assembly protein CpaE